MSMFLNRYLELLSEASKDDTKKKKTGDDPDAESEPAENEAEETSTEGENEADDPESGTEEANETDDPESGDEAETEEEGDQEDSSTEEEGNDESGEDGENAGEDDFSLDPDGGEEEDNSPPPDGLTDPDDDGSGDDPSSGDDPNAETNIQTNVLNLSKLDRLLMKRKCLADFYDLRTTVNTFRNIIEKNEASIEPTVREIAVRDLNKLYTSIEDYLMYKFAYINYEENLQNYFIFMQSMNAIVKNVDQNG